MADGSFPGLVSRDRNTNAQTNAIWVRLTDDTTAVTITGTALDVNVSNASITVTATQLDIDDLAAGIGAGEDNVLIFANTVKDGSGTDYVPLVDSDGHLQVDMLSGTVTIQSDAVDDSAFTIATDYVNVNGYLADETAPDSVDEGDVGAARMTLDRKQLHVLVDATTDSQRLAINASGEAQVDVAAHALTNANALPISKDNSANAETNPIYVYQVNSVVSGYEVHDYDTAAAVAADAVSNHDYAVANTTLFLKSVIVAGSGNIKFEIIDDPGGTPATIAVGFLTGRQGDTKQVFFDPAFECTTTLRVQRTNRQGAATDLYSTIIGNDV
jgi:hypothetical protein